MHGWRGTPCIPPVFIFSSLTESFTGALAQKSQHLSVGIHCFPERDDGVQGQGLGLGLGLGVRVGDYSVPKLHIVCSGKYQSSPFVLRSHRCDPPTVV